LCFAKSSSRFPTDSADFPRPFGAFWTFGFSQMPESTTSKSQVEIAAGRIIVRPSFADLVTCARIGGAWDAALGAWTFPATEKHSRLIQERLHTTTVGKPEPLPTSAPDSPVEPPSAISPVPETPTAAADPQVAIPAGLATRPWKHQFAAFLFCLQHFAIGMFGILLAMGMGTGKTLVALMVLLERKAMRTLIVCPLRVVPVWVTQIERHLSIAVVAVALDDSIGSVRKKQEIAAEKLRLAEARGVPFICIINYESFCRDPFNTWAEKLGWDAFFMDEAHRAKSASGKISLACKRMRPRATIRIGMTGTPMPHGPMDIHPILRAIDVTVLGLSFSAFRQRHAVMGGYQNKQIVAYQKLDELEKALSRVMFRVGKEVLDLPPETHVTYYCDLTPEAARIYRDEDQDLVARVNDGTVTAANVMVKLLRLQQITGGCVPTDDGIARRVDSTKQKLLADTLEDIGNSEPVVVFCRFHADLNAVHEACAGLGYTSMELSGRRDELKQWQDGEAQVLAVQISAGGIGVDLTRARYSIYYSLSFSLGEYDQALSRVHRPGQTRPVEHIHLVARNTVDAKIMRALERRAEVVQSILAEIKN
jgi:SNF2 family DNA or RNA helicase